jgi:hypothetical protein
MSTSSERLSRTNYVMWSFLRGHLAHPENVTLHVQFGPPKIAWVPRGTRGSDLHVQVLSNWLTTVAAPGLAFLFPPPAFRYPHLTLAAVKLGTRTDPAHDGAWRVLVASILHGEIPVKWYECVRWGGLFGVALSCQAAMDKCQDRFRQALNLEGE